MKNKYAVFSLWKQGGVDIYPSIEEAIENAEKKCKMDVGSYYVAEIKRAISVSTKVEDID